MEIAFYPLLPLWIVLPAVGLALVLTWRLYRRARIHIAPRQRAILLGLRLASLALLALLLLCPGRVTVDRNLQKSHLVFLVDRSASMAARDLALGHSRLAEALQFLRQQRFPNLADFPRSAYLFNQAPQLAAKFPPPADVAPEGGTDLKAALDRVDKDLGLAQVAAVVLLSDGLDASGLRGEDVAVPIFSVQFGSDLRQVRDLGLGQVKVPARLHVNEEFVLDVPLELTGFAAPQRVWFRVLLDGRPLTERELRLAPGEGARETVSAVVREEGVHVLRLELPRLPDEASYLNNEREIAIEVVRARTLAAVYFPVLNTGFRPLLREFQADTDLQFTAFYKLRPGEFTLFGTPVDKLFAAGIPLAAGAMCGCTCFVLDAHNGELLSAPEAQALENYVSDGGSLILLGGSDSFGELPPGSPLERLSPVLHLTRSFTPGRYRVVPNEGEGNALTLKLRDLAAANAQDPDFLLGSLNLVREVKNGATVLLWADDGTRRPLLVAQPYGKGKVVAVLTNSLHLWGGPATRRDNFGVFWRQLLSYTRSQDDRGDLLRLAVNKSELAAGEALQVTALTQLAPAAAGQAPADQAVSAELAAREGSRPVRRLALTRRAESWSGIFPELEPGRYTLKATLTAGGQTLRERYRFVQVGQAAQEAAELASTHETFRRFSSDRHIYRPDEAERLESDLRQVVRRNEVRRERFPIFENPAFYLLLLALLGSEWFLRRRYNLY